MTHIIGVDQPRHLSVRDLLAIHKTLQFALAPAVVDVDNGNHVPLQRDMDQRS